MAIREAPVPGVRRLESYLAVGAALLALAAGTACKKETVPPTEPPPSGGLAGSPAVDLSAPGLPGPDVVESPVVVDAATAPASDTAPAPPPERPDAAPPPPPPPPPPAPAGDAAPAPPATPPDAG
ncbi:MAG: hypothetical protein JXB32_16760, partial [Deltaproteobacteria bacterium]|nr:hypothetical protein [Deltaproteobacteria bacterium]